MPMIYYVPAFHKVIKNLPKASEYLIFVDLQNLAIGKHDTDNETVLTEDLVSIVKNEVKYLLEYLETVYSTVSNCKVYFFYDENRNLFNEKLIPTWKQERKKTLSKLTYDRQTIHNLSSNISKAVSDTLYYLSKYSTFLNVVKLKYIDSDFIPGMSIVTKSITNSDTVFLIVTSDFDFIHLTQRKNVFLYDTRNRKRFKGLQDNNLYIPDTLEFLLKKIGGRFDIKDENQCLYIYNNYQLIHALVGDTSDSIPTLIKKVGIKTILKKTEDLLSQGNIVDRVILDGDFGIEFIKRLTDKDVEDYYIQLLNRLLITDFTLLSTIILEHANILPKKYLESYNHLDQNITRHFSSVLEDINESLVKQPTTMKDVELVKSYFMVERDIEKYFLIS